MSKSPAPVLQLSDAEWTVMDAVWALDGDVVRAREVLDVVEASTGWSYSTVKTLLGRLVEKGALTESKRGNVSVYAPKVTRSRARRSALRAFVDRAFGGTVGSLIHHLVAEEKLSPRQRDELRRLLDADREAGS